MNLIQDCRDETSMSFYVSLHRILTLLGQWQNIISTGIFTFWFSGVQKELEFDSASIDFKWR